MNAEELMNPRYEVITDYPSNQKGRNKHPAFSFSSKLNHD